METDPMPATEGTHAPATPDWPMRAWSLALAGALIGVAVQRLTNGTPLPFGDPLRIALATFLAVAGIVAAFVVERGSAGRALAFAVATGVVLALVAWWSIPTGTGSWPFPWRIACAMLSAVIAVPMWLSWRPGTIPRLPYPALHRHAWTAGLLWCGACLFVAIVWKLAFLLGELFGLIGLTGLRTLLHRGWSAFLLMGAAFGGGIGLLRDRQPVITAARRAVAAILTVLAPVLAAGLVIFLVALPFTGLTPLWGATSATTPVLLCCIAGALLLVDAAIGDGPESEARHPAFRGSVIALSVAILPLALIAAMSTGIRIHQHGMTPDRLWALTFVVVACAYGLAYAVAVARRRGPPAIRQANRRLAIGVAGAAIVLATPLVPFGRIAARDQVARLERGAVSPDAFDWTALRFDFGPAGVEVLRQLARSGMTPRIRAAATDALARQVSWMRPVTSDRIDPDRLVILPHGTALPPSLQARLPDYNACFNYGRCAVLMQPGGGEAVIVNGERVNVWRRTTTGAWARVVRPDYRKTPAAGAAFARGDIEVRTVTRRQLFVAGHPVYAPFE